MVSGLLMAEVTAVKANNYCSIIGRLMDQSIFISEDATGDLNKIDPAGRAGLKHFQTAHCTVSKSSEGNSYHCVWKFPLQSPDAAQKFRDIEGILKECMRSGTAAKRDKGVNHPDFYDAAQFLLENAKVTLSIKEKSTLQNTFISLRILPLGQ